MSIKLLPYKAGSQSAKVLAEALGIKRLKLKDSKWRGKAGDTVINWGNSKGTPSVGDGEFLNQPLHVETAANKLKTQHALKDKPYCLPFMTDINVARRHIERGMTVVCRTKLTGNSGEGIVIAETLDQLVEAPLYTVYKKKTQEYRVHVFDGKVISVQRKARKKDVADADVNWKVRNLDGGFIFARTGFDVPQSVVDAALGAMGDLKLDFGAVDVGYHKDEGTYVYEVNTACGLDGSNLTDYVEAFCDKLGIAKPVRPADYVPPILPKLPVAEQPKQKRVVIDADVPAAPEPIEVHPRGSKQNPLGVKTKTSILRQIRPDLNTTIANTNPDMVDNYAGKWAYFEGEFKETNGLIIKDGMWVWGKVHLVPVNTFKVELGNLKVELDEEEQAKLVEFLIKLKG